MSVVKVSSMQVSQTFSCFSNCASTLTREELNEITNNVYKTLEHPCGREMFHDYLEHNNDGDSVNCLELYDMCSQILKSRQKLPLNVLIEKTKAVRDRADDDVPHINQNQMKLFEQALDSEKMDNLIEVLQSTMNCCSEGLRKPHESFKAFVVKNLPRSCPLTP